LLEVLELMRCVLLCVLEVMCCVLLCIFEAVEGGLYLPEVLEVMRSSSGSN